MTASISRRALSAAVEARLRSIPRLAVVYVGTVTGDVPVQTTSGRPDPGGIVATYAVLYPGAGRPTTDGEDLAETSEDLDWSCQVTVAGGTSDNVLAGVDAVHGALHRWRPPSVDGLNTTGLVPPEGYDPGPVRLSPGITPARFYLPLQYRLTATT